MRLLGALAADDVIHMYSVHGYSELPMMRVTDRAGAGSSPRITCPSGSISCQTTGVADMTSKK